MQRQAVGHPRHDRGLDTLDYEILAVGVVENVAHHGGVEERDLHVVPVFLVDRAVPLQAMIEKFRLPADFIVGQAVGCVRHGNRVLQHPIGAVGMLRAAVLVEAAWSKTLRERVVDHHIRCHVPGQVAAALGAGLGVAQIGGVQVVADSWIVASGGRDARLEAVETRHHAAGGKVFEQEVARAECGGQHFRDQVEVDRRKECRLPGLAHRVLVERAVVVLDAGIHDRGAGECAGVRQAAAVARRSRRRVRGTGRNGLVHPIGLVE